MTDTQTRVPPVPVVTTTSPRSRGEVVLVSVFTLTAFAGAALLFVVQPMVARLVLPSFGGSATVWSTSSLFFQVLLLLGYSYAHAATRRLGSAWQPPVHLLVLLAPLVVLPIALPSDAAPDAGSSPVLWLLRVLLVMIGLPFLVISTSGPLLQRWYSWSGGPRAEDPYFLFAASNLGSFGGLLAYPFVVEPHLSLDQQRVWWSWGFVSFVVLTASCALLTWHSGRRRAGRAGVASVAGDAGLDGPAPGPELDTGRPAGAHAPHVATSTRRVVQWALWAFLPSAMMLAVTAHVSTDIAPIPLLWVVPLAIYLATFVVAFGRTSRLVPVTAVRLAVASTFLAAAAAMMQARTPILLGVVLNMVMLALVAFVAHARLAADRPPAADLTRFYLVVAAGGALGGLLNGMVAPLVFDRVLEYPIVTAMVPLLLIAGTVPKRFASGSPAPVAGPAAVPAVSAVPASSRSTAASWVRKGAVALAAAVGAAVLGVVLSRWADQVGLALVGLALAALAGWLLSTRRVLVAVILLLTFVGAEVKLDQGSLDHRRTFFGSYRVFESGGRHQFAHGTTVHGTQWQDERRTAPTTYYARSGPLGDVFATPGIKDVGVVGLGVGTLAAYGTAGQTFTFVEIDPAVVEIARDPRMFTYLTDSSAQVDVLVGDGRLEVAKLPHGSLDVLVLDAFSSDAIPVHLLTEEAMRTYAASLRPGGLLVVHISNKVFDLAPVLAGSAASLGWDSRVAFKGSGAGASQSRWVVLSADEAMLGELTTARGWSPLGGRAVEWTDDYSSILSVLR
jgi:SAM-dependent methyltransferase